jgi:ABC-type glycerol-3-phosphate transport system substrate-binding protein
MARLDTLIAGGQQIDVSYLNTSNVMNRALNGAVLPLDEAIKTNGDDFVKLYGKLGAEATALNGQIYGVPRAGNTFKVYYNKTMADRYGINVPDQMTQAEFLEVAKRFRSVPGLKYPACINVLWVQSIYASASIAGWQMVRKDSRGNVTVNFDDPRFRDTLKFYHDFAQVEKLSPTAAIYAAESMHRRRVLAMQECGLILDGPFTLIWLQSYMYNDPGNGKLPFELGVAEIPVLTQIDKTRASYMEMVGAFFAPSTNKNLLEAYRYMTFICNDNFDINGVYMPIYTGSDFNTAIQVFMNFIDKNGTKHTNIFPTSVGIRSVTVPNDSHLGVFPMDPSLNKYIPPLDALLEEQFPVYFNSGMSLDNFIRELTRRGQDIVSNIR